MYHSESVLAKNRGVSIHGLSTLQGEGPKPELCPCPWTYHFILLVLKELTVTLFHPHAYSTGAQALISGSEEEVGRSSTRVLIGRQ